MRSNGLTPLFIQELRVPLDTAAIPERLLDEGYDEELGHDHDEHQEADQYILDRHVDNKGESKYSKGVKSRSQKSPIPKYSRF